MTTYRSRRLIAATLEMWAAANKKAPAPTHGEAGAGPDAGSTSGEDGVSVRPSLLSTNHDTAGKKRESSAPLLSDPLPRPQEEQDKERE